MFLLRKPSVLFAFPVILSMWEFQDRPEEMSPQVSSAGQSLQDLSM